MINLRRIAVLVVMGTTASLGTAAPPGLNLVHPPAAQPGVEARVRLFGQNLDKSLTLVTPFAAEVRVDGVSSDVATLYVKPAQGTPPGVYPVRVRTSQGISNVRLMTVSRLPVILEQEPNDRLHEAKPIQLPALLTGELAHPANDVDIFRFTALAKQRLTFVTETRRLGLSPELLVRIRDSEGRELAYSNNTPGLRADELLDHTFDKAGEYTVEVHSAAFSNTAWTNLYCLKVGELDYAQAVFPLGGKRGQKTRFTVTGRDGATRSVEAQLPSDPWLKEWRLPLDDFPGSMPWPINNP